jgi:hypothetical protein
MSPIADPSPHDVERERVLSFLEDMIAHATTRIRARCAKDLTFFGENPDSARLYLF